jgi:hypothetical protein
MFKEIDLSKAVPANVVAVSFRYQITGRGGKASLPVWLADNPRGQDPILLAEDSGRVTVRLRICQKLYYNLGNSELHLNLWIVGYKELRKHSC